MVALPYFQTKGVMNCFVYLVGFGHILFKETSTKCLLLLFPRELFNVNNFVVSYKCENFTSFIYKCLYLVVQVIAKDKIFKICFDGSFC